MALEVHPVAELFPALSGEDLDRLAADISANGLREPIWLHPDGRIVDGRNRYAACEKVDVPVRTREWDGRGSLVEFVVSLNLHRRHLSTSQRAAVAVDMLPLLEDEARQRMLAGKSPDPGQIVDQGRAAEAAANIVKTNRQYVADAKKLKAEAPDVYERVRAGTVTIPEAKREIRQADKAVRVAAIAAREPAPLDSSGPFDVLYADPPWRYEHAPDDTRQVENHYPTMSLDDIKALQPPAATDAVLFMWVTSPKLAEGMEVLQAWGFDYRTCAVWVKDRLGMGYYVRQQHELLLIARRGSLPVPDPEDRPSSVISAPRGQHSAKPDQAYELIERMYPLRDKCELFQRRPRDGWAGWGNQAGAA